MADNWKTFGITIIIIISIISLILTFAYLSRECNTNLDCSNNEYCAYNNKCIPFPAEKEEYSLLPSSILIGISIIISALILRKNYNIRLNKNQER